MRKRLEISRANLELQTELKRTEIEKEMQFAKSWNNRPRKWSQSIVN